ncbi:phosphotransferase [Nocardia sp. CA-107356]|uniref:phosphotransferase n=1 Tax=Nocardia sp. CA-107356 TaxID=3239972 RepID=UPI003D90233F
MTSPAEFRAKAPLPDWYPESGDSEGFLRMLAEYDERNYQNFRKVPWLRTAFKHLGFPKSLTGRLNKMFTEARPQTFALIHADLTHGNILRGANGVTVVDYGLALYGPPDYDDAVKAHRNADSAELRVELQPHLYQLDVSRALHDTVRLLSGLRTGTLEHDQALALATNVTTALARANVVWGRTPTDTARTYLFDLVRESFNEPPYL